MAAGTAPTQPKFAVEGGLTFDFGELFTLVPVTRELKITNPGTDTLRLSRVSASCGCTATLLSNNDVPPGGTAGLKVTFDPAKFKGGVQKIVTLHTNDPAAPKPEITFTATVSAILELERTHLVLSTQVNAETTAVVTLKNVSAAPVRITGATANSPDLKLAVSRDALAPGANTDLTCRIRQSKPGLLRAEITLATDNPLVPSIVIPVLSYAR